MFRYGPRGLCVCCVVVIGVTVMASVVARADAVVEIAQPPADAGKWQYAANRAPLAPVPMARLPIGSITPRGWLHEMLRLEADGLAGHLEELSPWCKFEGSGWTDPKGEGKNGWEEVPYWLRGFGDLGYVLGDQRITSDAKRWIDAIFAAQSPDGFFGPHGLRTALKGKPDLWPHMPILNAMQSYYEYSGDRRAIDLMSRYFKYELALPDQDFISGYWDRMRTGDNLESVYWLYNRTGDARLLDLADKLHRHAAAWTKGVPNWHNVNLAEGFREPAEYSMQSKNAADYAATINVYHTVMGMYGQVPGGGFGGDENCRPGFTDPRQGFETCGIVEYMHSFEMLSRIRGDATWDDRCEELAFNSLPAALTPDLKALHYLTAPNQVQLDKKNKAPGIDDSGTMFSYSPLGVYRCCQHNHSMGWPYFAEEMWSATSDGGLAATLYAASEVKAKVVDGSSVKIAEITDYPFSDALQFKVSIAKPVGFPLYLRVPGWCDKPAIAINGQPVALDAEPDHFIQISRTWSDGDTVALTLPMKLQTKTWTKNKDAVSVDYGPLTFSLDIGEEWSRYGGTDQFPEQEVRATTPWNYGLVLDAKDPAASFEVVKKDGPVAAQPFTPQSTPIEIHARGQKIPNWRTDHNELLTPLQPSPVKSDESVEPITLIPMGAARLRLSAFPVVGSGSDAHEWVGPPRAHGPAGDAKVTASFDGPDAPEALNDGILPASSSDETVPRFTWWDHKGTDEWVRAILFCFRDPDIDDLCSSVLVAVDRDHILARLERRAGGVGHRQVRVITDVARRAGGENAVDISLGVVVVNRTNDQLGGDRFRQRNCAAEPDVAGGVGPRGVDDVTLSKGRGAGFPARCVKRRLRPVFGGLLRHE